MTTLADYLLNSPPRAGVYMTLVSKRDATKYAATVVTNSVDGSWSITPKPPAGLYKVYISPVQGDTTSGQAVLLDSNYMVDPFDDTGAASGFVPAAILDAALSSNVVLLNNIQHIVQTKYYDVAPIFGNGPIIDPTHPDFGAKGDGRYVTDAVTNGTNVVQSATANFSTSDIGKLYDVFVYNTSSTVCVSGVITGFVDSSHIQIDQTIAGASGLAMVLGTDDTVAIQNWINGTGAHAPYSGARTLNYRTYFVTAALNIGVNKGLSIYGPGTIWFSGRLAASNGFNWADTAGSTGDKWYQVGIISSTGHTGRQISAVCTPENQDIKYFFQCVFVHWSLTHDYMVYGDGAQCYEDACSTFCGSGAQGSKMYGCNSPGSEVVIVNSILPSGRMFFNVQQGYVAGCALGPQRLGNNSLRDGTGTAQQTNTMVYVANYMYDASGGLGDFRNIASVAVSVAGEGAEGTAFPNVNLEGCYVVYGGTSSAISPISANFSAGQGGAVLNLKGGTTFVQSAASTWTTVNPLVASTGGVGLVVFAAGVAANIKAAVTTAVLFARTAGNTECVIEDYIPSGQATIWQHPFLSSITATPQAWLANSAASVRNTAACPLDLFFTEQTGSPITLIEMSSDNSTFTTMWSGTGSIVVPIYFRWPAGVWLRLTFASTKPNFVAVPVR